MVAFDAVLDEINYKSSDRLPMLTLGLYRSGVGELCLGKLLELDPKETWS